MEGSDGVSAGETIRHIARLVCAPVTQGTRTAEHAQAGIAVVLALESRPGPLKGQNWELRAACDLPLPRLMSGEIEV